MARKTPIQNAIKDLGGPSKAAETLGRKQPTISGYLAGDPPPADVCMRIELATKGKHRAEAIRPDLADVFRQFRSSEEAGRAA